MGLELATTIKQLDKLWPEPSDDVSQGDDHLRLLKKVLKLIFPGANGEGFAIPITATEEEINFLRGVTSNIQEQINSKGGTTDFVSITGDRMTGDLIVENEIFTVLELGGDRTGYNMIGPNGEFGGAIYYNFGDHSLHLEQAFGETADIETIATLKGGNIIMSSETHNTDPTDAKSLTTKEYVDSVVTGGDPGTGAYLPLTGGTLTGDLDCNADLNIVHQTGSIYSIGLKLHDDETNSEKGYFGWDPALDVVHIAQSVNAASTPDTSLKMTAGKVSLTSDTGFNTSATENQHLTTKQYVDNAVASGGTGVEYLPLTGGTLTGELEVNETVIVLGDAETAFPGLDIRDRFNRDLGAFVYDTVQNHVGIVQNGSPGSVPDTTLEIYDGKVIMTSPSGKSTLPTESGHLTTKAYVDSVAGGTGYVAKAGDVMYGNLIMDGSEFVQKLSSGSAQEGLVFTNSSSQTNGSLYQQGSNGHIILRCENADHNGSDVQLDLGDGNIAVQTNNSADSIMPKAHNDLTIKRYVDEFLLISKGAGLEDDMLVNGNVWAKAKSGDDTVGLALQDTAGNVHGGMYYDVSNNQVSVTAGSAIGNVSAGITLKNGQAKLWSTSYSTIPNSPESLATKFYCDDNFAPIALAQELNTAKDTISTLVADLAALQATVAAL